METTEDAFLGGRLQVLQPARGYRAGADPVFLAAVMRALPGETVLDLGCGVGVAMLCLKARLPDVTVSGIELQADLVGLACQNFASNDLSGEVLTANAAALPTEIRSRVFDHVMTNPPYFQRQSGSNAQDAGRETGRGETMALADWIDVALRRLKPGGTLGMINRVERLPDCLSALNGRVGDIRLLPLASRQGRPAKLVVFKGKKGAKGGLALLPPLILHQGSSHDRDGDSYTPEAQAVLRHGQPLDLGG